MILLFNPRSARWKHRLPLSLLSVAAGLEGKYDYQIVDGNFETNALETLSRIIVEKEGSISGRDGDARTSADRKQSRSAGSSRRDFPL
jgi:hypothetical protein